MTLSIVIPSYKRADLLALCLQSLQLHAPVDAEILVVDDASTDGVISKTALQFAGVKCLRLEKSAGFCIAANAGIRATTGDIVELLNDDTQVRANWSKIAMRAFDDPTIGAVAPLVLQGIPDELLEAIIDSAGDIYHSGGFAQKRFHNRRLKDVKIEADIVFGASASSAFYRRSALENTGLFPENFVSYFEDVDLAHRLNRAGYRTRFEPASVVWHQVGASHGRKPSRQLLERQSLNEERVFWRNVSLRHLPVHVAVLSGKAIRRFREGMLIPFIVGRLRALSELREHIQHRQSVPHS